MSKISNNPFKKTLVAIVVIIIVALVFGCGFFQISKSRTFQFFGVLIDHVDTNQKVIGQSAEEYPNQLDAIIAGGHEVGNHSFIGAEIEITNQII